MIRTRQILWFLLLWFAGVAVLGAIAFPLRLWLNA